MKCTVEENSLIGGLGAMVKSILFGYGAEVECIGLPDKFIEHGDVKVLRKKYGFTSEAIADKALRMFI
jgi:1-deoxy-D-xylulose-5-phosphate synthase